MSSQQREQIVMHYDTTCTFCRWCADFVQKRQLADIVLIHTDDTESITVLTPDSETLRKYAACIYIGKQLTQPWRFFAHIFYYLPRPLGDAVYDWVQRNRSLLVKILRIK
jgi:predicted DCC family thiol-disulfide oxidoreductase YuxK